MSLPARTASRPWAEYGGDAHPDGGRGGPRVPARTGDRAGAEPAYRLALTAARRLVEEQALARRFRHAAVRLRAVSEAGQGRTAGSLPVLDPPS
jgi:hypothetical protein